MADPIRKELTPSILTADYGHLADELKMLEDGGVKWLHLDVMDGMFVPNITFGMPLIRDLRKISSLFFDVHLMIEEPERYIEAFADAGSDLITVHIEAVKDAKAAIDRIHAAGKWAGLSLRPGTDLQTVIPYLPELEMLLVMSVEPGFGGQSYIPASTDRIRALDAIRKKEGLSFHIGVDGGINPKTIETALAAGADNPIGGSCVFSGTREEKRAKLCAIQEIMRKWNGGEA